MEDLRCSAQLFESSQMQPLPWRHNMFSMRSRSYFCFFAALTSEKAA